MTKPCCYIGDTQLFPSPLNSRDLIQLVGPLSDQFKVTTQYQPLSSYQLLAGKHKRGQAKSD